MKSVYFLVVDLFVEVTVVVASATTILRFFFFLCGLRILPRLKKL